MRTEGGADRRALGEEGGKEGGNNWERELERREKEKGRGKESWEGELERREAAGRREGEGRGRKGIIGQEKRRGKRGGEGETVRQEQSHKLSPEDGAPRWAGAPLCRVRVPLHPGASPRGLGNGAPSQPAPPSSVWPGAGESDSPGASNKAWPMPHPSTGLEGLALSSTGLGLEAFQLLRS